MIWQSCEASNKVEYGGYLLQGLPCLLHAEMPQEAEDERRIDAELLLRILQPQLQHVYMTCCRSVLESLACSPLGHWVS